ncbi:MAG: Outer membrane protein assembly factor BamB [Phycisphaerae bacterium]|nr:Outer membrane protein assembly factor BamB [Phycisphaerae bacterium]
MVQTPVTPGRRGRAWFLVAAAAMLISADAAVAQPADAPAPAKPSRDPYKDLYRGYKPDFIDMIAGRSREYSGIFRGWQRDEKEMKLSTEPNFYTLNYIQEDTRAAALVEAGLARESAGQYREALKIYQQIIEKYPSEMYRVSDYGVFVPVAQYCQRRILSFPPKELAYYRTMYDAPAAEAFLQARRQYSLLGLSDVAGQMLATSFGGRALIALGDAALDSGHYLAALEYFTTVRDYFAGDRELRTAELALKIAYCRKMLGESPETGMPAAASPGDLDAAQLAKFREVVNSARYVPPPFHEQLANAPGNISADDYTLMPPPADPQGLTPATWKFPLPGSRRDFCVYSQPVVTPNSVIYRHKNIVYCRSILNGELRWTNDLGGRAVWQNWNERQYPLEDVLVQDGRVFTVVSKAGPSLVALDEVTGQLKWAYGPMVASNEEEANMRFEAAPAGGPRTIFAGYVLDNIQGETHTDSEYGVIAFDSATGRIHWRTPICRLAPGKFAGGFAEHRRNRIRSFTSPPLYHQGTIYYCTNAGAIAAMDALSGQVKWLMRYPYWPGVHDATREFGELRGIHGGVETVRPHRPMFWLDQSPLLVGERLYLTPVDTTLMLCLDRRTGKVGWSRPKMGEGFTWFLGPLDSGELVVVTNGRNRFIFGGGNGGPPVVLLDPKTGETLWKAPNLVKEDDQPVMKLYFFGSRAAWFSMNDRWFENAARPFLTRDGKLYISNWTDASIWWRPGCYVFHLTGLDLKTHKIDFMRRYYTGTLLAHAEWSINSEGPEELKSYEEVPNKDDDIKNRINILKAVVADHVPENEHGPFMPFSRVTFQRYGVPFELRMDARSVQMVYDRAAVDKAIAGRPDPQADFARAELAVTDSRLDDAARLLNKCLATISSEDLDFRAAINQQLYRVHELLARRAIRAGRPADELANCLGMSRTASTLAEEIQTLFAVADACRRRGDLAASAQALRTIVATYGQHEFPVSPVAVADAAEVTAAARAVIDQYQKFLLNPYFEPEVTRGLQLNARSLPLYFSTVSPLPRTLTVRASELASLQLMRMVSQDASFAATLDQAAAKDLAAATDPQERLQIIGQFPATPASQKALDTLFARAGGMKGSDARQEMWKLADAARVAGLRVPDGFVPKVAAPAQSGDGETVALPQKSREHDFADEEGAARLVLERRGERNVQPQLMFIGSRIRRRLDNKFDVTAMDLATGKIAWDTGEFRLKGTGAEPGFFEAFVHAGPAGAMVIVHGLYDVFALDLGSGKEIWSYRVPFDFEIRHALLTGDLLVLWGKTETLALFVDTDSKAGEVAWQRNEQGDLYVDPWADGDRLVAVRKLPYSVTVRYRATGQLIGRLGLPDLSQHAAHPLIEDGPEGLPAAHEDGRLVVSDGWYYIMIDTTRLKVLWKRLIDNNDLTREPAMRFSLGGGYFSVLKEDYDQKMIYMLSADTGQVLWKTDPKDARSPQPMHHVLIVGGACYGIQPHAGQGFYLVGRDCKTGKLLFSTETSGYDGRPQVELVSRLYGGFAVVRVVDRQRVEVKVFDTSAAGRGKDVCTVGAKGVPPFGVHGRVSATVQSGRAVLLSKDKLQM